MMSCSEFEDFEKNKSLSFLLLMRAVEFFGVYWQKYLIPLDVLRVGGAVSIVWFT